MRILLVEDDISLCNTLKFQLEKENYTVDLCHDGEDALFFIRERAHDVILLDRMLPSLNGLQVLETIRQEGISTPILMVTALGALDDRISGLDTGADDYIIKPFAFEELLARIRCIIRRPVRWEEADVLERGDLTYHPEAKKLYRAKKYCSLSKKEGDLLEVLLRNFGQTLPRTTLLLRVWGPDADVEDGNLDNYIHFLRRRLKSLNSCVQLRTVRGVGYCLEENHV